MHAIEAQILSLIGTKAWIYDCLNQLYALPIGTLTKEFYEDPRVQEYCIESSNKMFSFRLALEKYIHSDRSQSYLENVEAALLQLPSPLGTRQVGLQNKTAGTYLMPITSELICQVYLLEDELLTNLFQKHFPAPPVRLFNDLRIPHIVQKKAIEIDETMKKIDVKKIEPFIVKVQRNIRMKRRHQEEQNRIALRDKNYLESSHMTPKDLIQDASTPYKPKCSAELSERIVAMAKKVAAFSTVKHKTSEQGIQNIFDESLYGRRTLMDFYLAFVPAALQASDVYNGDGNVACLGPQDIDPRASHDIIIEFDLPKLIQNKPSAFYKQRDFEYGPKRVREVQLGKETILFDHTRCFENHFPSRTYLKIMDGSSGRLKQFAKAQKSSFISYNLEQIHEVLTLNFFRFMDKMTDLNEDIDQVYIDSFYRKISQLTDEELFAFLTDLEKNMTDTAEFNFYGAHQIDFSTIINITGIYKRYTLNLPKFIHDLKQSNIDELRQARIKIPELFQSYRFLDYLLLQVKDSDARYYLDELRKQCKTPNWVKYTPLIVPEKLELSWKLHSEPDALKQEVLVAGENKNEQVPVTILEATAQIPVKAHQEAVEIASEGVSQIKVSETDMMPELRKARNVISPSLPTVTTEEPVQDDSFNKELQTYREQFGILIGKLEDFSSYLSSSHDNTVLPYQPFVQGLKKDFAEIGHNFFSEVHIRDKETLKRSFEIFKSECERLSQKAENHFKHNAAIWSYVKLILTGVLGVIIAIAATLLTLGIATYYVAKNEPLRSQYVDTFFKSEPRAIQDVKNKWTQYSVKQNLFGDESLVNTGLVNEINQTVTTRLRQ